MACVNCAKIRAAILHGKMAEAAGLSAQALREKFGLTPQSTQIGDLEYIATEDGTIGPVGPDASEMTGNGESADAPEPSSPRQKRTKKAG